MDFGVLFVDVVFVTACGGFSSAYLDDRSKMIVGEGVSCDHDLFGMK